MEHQKKAIPEKLFAIPPPPSLAFRYKGQAYAWNTTNGTYQLSNTTYFVYDAWNLRKRTPQAILPTSSVFAYGAGGSPSSAVPSR